MASLAGATPVPPATVNLGGLLPSLAGLDATPTGGNAPLIVVIHAAQTATPQVVHIHLHTSPAPTAAPSVPCPSTQQISTPAPHVQHVSPATFAPQPTSPHVAVAPISTTRQFSSPRVAPPTARSPLGPVSPTAASASGNAQWQPHVVRASPPLQPTRSNTSPRPAWRRVPTTQQQQAAAVAAASQVISAASPDRERDILDVLAELQQLEAVLNPPLNSASSSSALAMMTQVPAQGTGGWRRQPTLSQQQQQQLQQSRPSSFYGAMQLSQGPFGPESTVGGAPETVTDTPGEDMIFPLDPADDPALQPSASASAGAGVTPSIVDGHLPESVPISHLPSRTGSAYQTAAEDSPRLMHTTNMTALVPAVDASVPRQPTPDFPVNFPDGTDEGGGIIGRRSVQAPARPAGRHGGQQQFVDAAFMDHHHAQMLQDELLAHERVHEHMRDNGHEHEHRHVEDQPDSSWSMWVPGMQLPVSAPVPLNTQRPGSELWSPPAVNLASPPGLPASLYAGSPPIPNPHLHHQLVHAPQQQRPNARMTAASFGFGEASPRVRHASPRMEFASPPQRFISPPQHYTSSPQHYADVIQEDEYSAPPRQFASPPQQFASPPQLFTSPPRSAHGPPQSQLFTSPPQYYQETVTPSPTQTQFVSPQTHTMMEFSSPMQFASPLGPGHPDRALELDASVSTLVRPARSIAADEQSKPPTVPQDPFVRLNRMSPPVTSPIIRTSSRRLGANGRPLSMSDGSFPSLAGLAAAKSPMMTSSVQALPQQHSGGAARHPSQAWLSSHALYQQAQSMESSASLTESMLQFHQQMQEQAHAHQAQEQQQHQQQQQQQQQQVQEQEQQERYYQQSSPQSPSPPPHADQSAGMPSPPFNAGNLPEPVQQEDSDHDSDDHDPRQGHRHGLGHDQLGLIQEHDTLMGMPSSPDTLRFRSSNEVAGHAAQQQQQQQQQQPKRRQMTVRIAEGHQYPNRLAAARAVPRSPDYVWPTMARQATSPTAPGPGPAAMARAVTIAAPYSPPLSPAMPYSPPLSPPPQPPTQHTYPPRSTTNSGSGSGSKSSTSNSTSPAGPGVGRASSSSTMSMGVSSMSSHRSSSPTRTMYRPPSVIVPPSPNLPLLMDFAVRSPVMPGAMSPLGGGSPARPTPVHRNSGGRQRPGIGQQTQSQRSSATSQGQPRRQSSVPQGAPRAGSGEWTWVV